MCSTLTPKYAQVHIKDNDTPNQCLYHSMCCKTVKNSLKIVSTNAETRRSSKVISLQESVHQVLLQKSDMQHDARRIQPQKHQRMHCDRPRASKKPLRYINRCAFAGKKTTNLHNHVCGILGRPQCDTKDAEVRNLQYDFNIVIHVQFAARASRYKCCSEHALIWSCIQGQMPHASPWSQHTILNVCPKFGLTLFSAS